MAVRLPAQLPLQVPPLQLFEQQSASTVQASFEAAQEPPAQAVVSYAQVVTSQLKVPLVKPRLSQVSANATPSSHCSLPSTTPSPQIEGAGAHTRLEGFPPVQLPTPEQHGVVASQPRPSPSAMQNTVQSSGQPCSVSPPLQTPSPQSVPQSSGQLVVPSDPVHRASPQTSGQSDPQVAGSSEPVQSASPQTSGQSAGQLAASSPGSQTASPQNDEPGASE